MRWIDKAREVAKEYRHNCQELRALREAEDGLQARSQGTPVMCGKVSRPVEAEVERRQMQERRRYLEQATGAVEYAIDKVMEKPQGMITFNLFHMVYYDGTHKLYGAAQELHISEITAKRYNRFFLKMVAVAMGYLISVKDDTF